MFSLAVLLVVVALLVMFGTWLWLTAIAFKESPVWGIAVFLLSPFSALVFAVLNWKESKKPAIAHVLSIVVAVCGFAMMFSALGGFEIMELAEKLEAGEVSEEEMLDFMESQMDRMDAAGLVSEEERAEFEQARKLLREQQQGKQPDAGWGAATYEDVTRDLDRSAAERRGSDRTRTERQRREYATEAGAMPPMPSSPPRSAAWPTSLREKVPVGEADRHVGERFDIELRDGRAYKGTLEAVRGDTLIFQKWVSGGTVDIEVKQQEIATLRSRGR